MNLDLYAIFRTPIQVRIIEELLKRPNEYFTISRMAKLIDSSASAISSRISVLSELGIIKFIPGSEKAKIFYLNKDSEVTRILIEFYIKLRKIGRMHTDKLDQE